MRLVDTIGDYGLEGEPRFPLTPSFIYQQSTTIQDKTYNFPSLLNGRRGLRGCAVGAVESFAF